MSEQGGSGADGALKTVFIAIAASALAFILFVVVVLLATVALFTSWFNSSQTIMPIVPVGTGPIPADLIPVFNQAGQAFEVNPYLLASVAFQESSFGQGSGWNVVNFAGCVGFMQICIGGQGGNTWGETVTLTGSPKLTLTVSDAYKVSPRPTGYSPSTGNHPSYNDAFDAAMSAAVVLRAKVNGAPIPTLDQTAYNAACGYYGTCADATVNYAQDVFNHAQQWQIAGALAAGGPATPGTYVNPLGRVAGLIPERIDEGVDYAGAGPLLALGDGVVFFEASSGVGWPRYGKDDGGFVGYTLTDGLYKGDRVYVAENIDPLVKAGDKVTAGYPIATLHLGGADLETGWASGNTSEPLAASLHQGDPNGDIGNWMSAAGWSFNKLLVSLGATSGVTQAGGVHSNNGVVCIQNCMPPGYP
jgi:hypothetical protein